MNDDTLSNTKKSYKFVNVKQFSRGKDPSKNEDVAACSDTTIVLSDGATDKSGQVFEGRFGGELAAELVIKVCMTSQANGAELIAEATSALKHLYEKINPAALKDSAYRFAATLTIARIVDDRLVVTQLGDSPFRINGTQPYTNNKVFDNLTASARKQYIEITGDVAGSRDFIAPLLKGQHQYQNNTDSPLGYGIIDGMSVPEKFIKTFTFPCDTVWTVELASDGYYGVFPSEVSIAGYEALHEHIEQVDPDKYRQYPSQKSSDDRTVIIANLQEQ